MSFRARLLLAFLAVVVVPAVLFVLAVRKEMADRLTASYERRVAALVAVLGEDLEQENREIAVALAALRQTLADDNRFRRAAVDGVSSERRYLLDYAGNAMRLTGLAMLQIQDESGRILSSGHFRNEYDRLEPKLPELLSALPGGLGVVQARTAEGPFLALARVDTVRLGGRRFALAGGVSAESRLLARLAREGEFTVSLVHPGGVLSSESDSVAAATSGSLDAAAPDPRTLVGELSVPYIDAERGEVLAAEFRVSHPLTELQALRRSIDLWFLVTLAATALIALLLASWLSSRMSRPLVELARKTSRIDLDRLDVDFASQRRDELGDLSRLLGAMTDRLRLSAGRIKEAERRATLGELARQVNHDIKNGLIPIRNAFRHLFQVARDDPAQLPERFEERRGTVDSSIAYLEELASNYARLTPRLDRTPCDVNAVARQVVGDARLTGRAQLRLELSATDPIVLSDAVVLRRILENLVENALDSLESAEGTVSLSTEVVSPEAGRPTVRLTVSDTGVGMSEEARRHAFDDFYTTKAGGTGLGLSIVRRLVMDLDGSVRVQSEAGQGSRFVVELPAHTTQAGGEQP